MNKELLFVILNAVLYNTAFIYAYIKNKDFNIGVYILLIWAIASLFTIYYFTSGFMYNFSHHITILPFIYLFLLTMIFFKPILQFKSNLLNGLIYNNTIVSVLSIFIALISIELFLENINMTINIIARGGQGFAANYELRSDNNKSFEYLSVFGSRMNYIANWFNGITPILLFVNLSKSKINKYIIFGLIIAVLNPMLISMNLGSRFVIITNTLYLIFLYLVFKNLLAPRTKHIIIIYSGIIFMIVFLGIILITYFRYSGMSTDLSMLDWISLYIGESFVNFNADMWYVKHFTNGDNSFFLYKYILGLYDYSERQFSLLAPITGIRMHVFYTFIGDFFVDMGAYMTSVFVIISSLIFTNVLKISRIVPLHKIILLGMIGKVCVVGFTYFTYLNGQIETIFTILICFFMYLDFEINKKKSNNILIQSNNLKKKNQNIFKKLSVT